MSKYFKIENGSGISSIVNLIGVQRVLAYEKNGDDLLIRVRYADENEIRLTVDINTYEKLIQTLLEENSDNVASDTQGISHSVGCDESETEYKSNADCCETYSNEGSVGYAPQPYQDDNYNSHRVALLSKHKANLINVDSINALLVYNSGVVTVIKPKNNNIKYCINVDSINALLVYNCVS